MEKISNYVTLLHAKMFCTLQDIKKREEGDTNFVSMLLIIGIVVVLATAFLTLMNDTVMKTITQKITTFLNKLGG